MLQRRRRFAAVLDALGLGEAFAAIPRPMQEVFLRRKFPDPQLQIDASVPFDREGRAVRKRLDKAFSSAAFKIDASDADEGGQSEWAAGVMTSRDYLSVATGLLTVLRELKDLTEGAGLAETIRFVKLAAPKFERFHARHGERAFAPIFFGLNEVMLSSGRIEHRLLHMRVVIEPNEAQRVATRVTIAQQEPQVRGVVLDRSERPMYRAARLSQNAEGSVPWVAWRGEQFGGRAGVEYPIYVQSHALRQLQQRVNLPPALPFLQTWLGESLAAPNIVERQGRDLLVEYRLKEYRMGYLVVTPLKDLIAVRTFLFLTMQQTPEARLLEKKLKLTRRDVDWLGLSDLSAFTQTDLRHDAQLSEMLEACGCGHLFALAEASEGDYLPAPKPLAGEMRKYLRMAA